MLVFYKNKGLLVLLYPMVSLLVTAMLFGALGRSVGGVFARINGLGVISFGLLLAAVWTYLTKDTFYKDRDGNKKIMDDYPNEFMFLSMKIWAMIFLALAAVAFFFALLR